MHIYSLPDGIQNILLFHDTETGRAQMKRIRISYPEPKQCSANDYTTSLQRTASRITQHPMTRYACPNSTACNVQLMITLTAKQNTLLHREIESGRAILKSFRISWDSSSTHHPSSLERTLHNTRLFLRKPFPPRLPQRDDNTHLSRRRLARQLTPIHSTRQLPPSHTHV